MRSTVIIAAMQRELQPLVGAWQRISISDGSRRFVALESGDRVAMISGIGKKNAELAARAAVARYAPETLISVGLAGALIRSLKAGSVVTPNVVVDGEDGAEYRCAGDSGGVLVTASEIAGADAKPKLAERFHALAVDMEAAGVAKVAQEGQIRFRCVKAISDEADFVLPPLKQFLDAEGSFQSGRFAAWTVARPWQWARVATLGRNAAKATRALCDWLDKNLSSGVTPAEVVTLERTELQDVVPGRR